MPPIKTQLAVLGGGPGGYAAAFLAADLGLEVTLIEREANPGGVCLYRGCIPSKALLHVAKLLTEADEAAQCGVTFGKPSLDLKRMREWKNEVVAKMTGGLGDLSRRRKINYLQGEAKLKDASTLEVATSSGTETVAFDHAILATGSRPATVPGLDLKSPRLMDSTAALELPDIPKTLLVVGGGYIGLELGTVYSALGTRVTVVEMTPDLLPGADRDLVRVLQKRLQTHLHAILLSTRVTRLTEEKNSIRVAFAPDEGAAREQVFDRVLVAVGRVPNSGGLGLENTKIQTDRRGFVAVDAQRRTAEPTIYAIGDIAGEPMLAHKASHEGRIAVEAIAGHKVAFEPAAIPAVVFTDPEIAWCGLTETQAKQQGVTVRVGKFPWAASGRATTLGRNDGFTKLLIDPATERILGCGIVGTGAGELIAEAVVAIEMAALASDLSQSIHPHPTLSETLMESAESFFGLSTHIYQPRK